MKLITKVKQTVQRSIWPVGSTAKILRGHLRGYKFVVSENSGWSPIFGRWEPECQEIFARFLKPGRVVFDLGANNGIHSILFSKLVGNTGKVYAFEPLPTNIEEIRRNCQLNEISNVTIVPEAVGSEDGDVAFLLGLLDKQGSIVGIGRQSGKEVKVKLTTLQTFILNKNVKPDFVKIDIEGAESDALSGIQNIMGEIQPVFFIELHTPEQDRKVGAILQKFNYKAYRITEKNVDNDLGIPHLEKVKNLNLAYPHADGIWGIILALPDE